MAKNLVPAEEEVLEGIVIEHEGLPFGNQNLFGWDIGLNTPSVHYVLQPDGTIYHVQQPDMEWR